MDVIEMLRNLFSNEEHRARWEQDPERYLAEQGASNLTVAEINDAARFAFADTSLGAEVNVGGNQSVGDTTFCQDADQSQSVAPEVAMAVAEGLERNLPETRHAGESAPPPPAPATPPPPPAPAPHLTQTQQIEETINYYITNVTETNVDDRDTFVDNSVDVVNVGGRVDIDQDTVIASGDGSQAVGGDNNGSMNTGDGGVAANGDTGPIGTGSGNVVDNSATGGNRGDAETGDVIIGDGNEKNEVDIDFGEGGTDGPVNIGVGSGDTNQDNHTEDNDGIDYDDNDGIDDKDGVDTDDNDGIDYDDQDGIDYDDNDGIDVDADVDFGLGRRAELARSEVAELVEPTRELQTEPAALTTEPVEVPQLEIVEPAMPVEPIVAEVHPEILDVDEPVEVDALAE